MDAEALFTTFAIWEVALVVGSTLMVMVLMHPRTPLEWATTGKETAFALILLTALYRVVTGESVPQPARSLVWAGSAILLTTYLIIFFAQWAEPMLVRLCRACVARPWLAIVLAVAIVLMAYGIALVISNRGINALFLRELSQMRI